MMDRRGLLAGISGAVVAAGMPSVSAAAPGGLIRPPRLREGDVVGLVEPAGFTDDAFDLDLVKETIRAMGLRPKAAPHLVERYGYLAGKDADRAADVNAMYADPEVKAVFAVRGGWGCARMLPYLDFKTIRANPKLLTGFSDITALHLAFAARAGFTTIHGPNAASGWGKLSWDSFRAVAFDGATPTYVNPVGAEDRLVPRSGRIRTFGGGKASGRLLGGNLTVLTALMGTPWLPDFTGAILFVIAAAAVGGVKLAIVVGIVGALAVALVAVIQAALSGIYSAAVYRYAVDGVAPAGFGGQQLQSAFQPK